MRSGFHPDSRPPHYIGNPRPLFEHVRCHEPHPMLPSGAAGPASSNATVRPRDLTPVPQPIDFLAAFSRPKAPRLRSPSPCPYARHSSPSFEGPASGEQTQGHVARSPSSSLACPSPPPPAGGVVEVAASEALESPSLEGPASGDLTQVVDASGNPSF